MNGLVKGGLALGGLVLGLGVLRRALNPTPRYAPWEKPPYNEFEKKVLVLGGGFGGYTAATDLCKLIGKRDDVGVLVIARDNFFTFWPMVPGIVSSDIDARNVAQPLRRALILAGASFRRARVKGVDTSKKVVEADGSLEFPYDQLIISLGGQPNFFGIPGVEEHSMTMRGVEDAERGAHRLGRGGREGAAEGTRGIDVHVGVDHRVHELQPEMGLPGAATCAGVRLGEHHARALLAQQFDQPETDLARALDADLGTRTVEPHMSALRPFGLDVKAMRTTVFEESLYHLDHSKTIFERLLEVVRAAGESGQEARVNVIGGHGDCAFRGCEDRGAVTGD